MVRRRNVEEHENHERWVISYADFITLLFAFFVVMYSISSVNEGKYKVLSDSLVSVFHAEPKHYDPVSVGDQLVRSSNDQLVQLPVPGTYSSKDDYKFSVEGLFDDVESRAARQGDMKDNEIDRLSKLSEQLAMKLQKQIDDDEIDIRANDEWIEVNIKASVLFPSGSAGLVEAAAPILEKVAGILEKTDNPIHVEGYTDNIPIETSRFPSNWELSAGRAASVVRLFEELNIKPERMAAVGYGEYHPVADNNTEEGRAKNRRIALVISKNDQAKPSLDTEKKPSDYKMGQPGSTGQNPILKRKQAEVPLRIIRLEDGGLLFSGEALSNPDSKATSKEEGR